jgi:hypothetical protein
MSGFVAVNQDTHQPDGCLGWGNRASPLIAVALPVEISGVVVTTSRRLEECASVAAVVQLCVANDFVNGEQIDHNRSAK